MTANLTLDLATTRVLELQPGTWFAIGCRRGVACVSAADLATRPAVTEIGPGEAKLFGPLPVKRSFSVSFQPGEYDTGGPAAEGLTVQLGTSPT